MPADFSEDCSLDRKNTAAFYAAVFLYQITISLCSMRLLKKFIALMHGLRSSSPSISAAGTKTNSISRLFIYAEASTPATASRRRFTPYLNGRKGDTARNGSGRTSMGNVPPDPATWITRRITAAAVLRLCFITMPYCILYSSPGSRWTLI